MPETSATEVALRWLQDSVAQLEWRVAAQSMGADVGFDIVGRGERREQVVVVVKRLHGANRIENLKGAAAMAVLDLLRLRLPKSTSRLVWLSVDRLGAQAVDKFGAYLAEVAPDIAWVVMDAHGGVRAHIPEFGIDMAIESTTPVSAPRSSVQLFRDLNNWMLKILLMHHAPAWAWTATRGSCRNPRSLATLAGVSDATAHRFVKVMTEADYLRQGRGSLKLVRVESLLRSWRASYQAHPPTMIEARPVFDLAPEQWGNSVLGKCMALGGEFAARHFKLQHATRGRRTIWVEADLEAALEALDLVAAEPGRGQLWIGRPRCSESCFRARVIHENQAFIDPCELMLESSMDPTRGAEQSDYLLDRILAWQTNESRDDGYG